MAWLSNLYLILRVLVRVMNDGEDNGVGKKVRTI